MEAGSLNFWLHSLLSCPSVQVFFVISLSEIILTESNLFASRGLIFALCVTRAIDLLQRTRRPPLEKMVLTSPFSLARYEACAFDRGNNTLVTALVSPACLDGNYRGVLYMIFFVNYSLIIQGKLLFDSWK